MADLEPQAAAAGVTATVVVQTVAEPGETPELLALAAGNHLIAGVVGWVDLASPGSRTRLPPCASGPARTGWPASATPSWPTPSCPGSCPRHSRPGGRRGRRLLASGR